MRTAEEILQWAVSTYGDRFAIVTSFQKEGMVLIDMAARLTSRVRVLTIDTGRLPAQTLAMAETVERTYGVTVQRLHPETSELQRMVDLFGEDLFREEVALRKLCCQIRKVRPLDVALTDLDAYAVGLRKGQSEARATVEQIEDEGARKKLSPIAGWTTEEVELYTATHGVPVHPLYAAGFSTIGCAPCSRPVYSGEDIRAGRWWWELDGDKECGLHFTPEGKIERKLDVLLREIVGTHA